MSQAKKKLRILLIDDDPDSLAAMAEWLEHRDFEPIPVADGEAALAHLNDGVAVIVTDLRMPKTDGLKIIRYARQHAPHAIVIVVSGDTSVDAAVASIREGAFDYLTKPINLKELSHRIEMALQKRAQSPSCIFSLTKSTSWIT